MVFWCLFFGGGHVGGVHAEKDKEGAEDKKKKKKKKKNRRSSKRQG